MVHSALTIALPDREDIGVVYSEIEVHSPRQGVIAQL
jgi:hypothetical protein